MKKLFLISFLFLMFVRCNSKKSIEKDIQIQVSSFSRIINKGSSKNHFYKLELELINESNSPISYWRMSCSWQDNWFFMNKKLTFCDDICDGNFPKNIKLMPKQKEVFVGVVFTNDTINITKDLQVGFLFIKKYDINNDIDFNKFLIKKYKNKENIIFSKLQ
jgi:hypothetical protein